MAIADYPEVVARIGDGWAVRMYDGCAKPTFVVPGQLRFSFEPYAVPDELWAYCLPQPPCSPADIAADVIAAISCHPGLASVFAGDRLTLPMGGDASPPTPLSQRELVLAASRLAALAMAAHASAFRSGADRPIGSTEFDQVATAISFWRMQGRVGGPSRIQQFPALRLTLRCALMRHALVTNQLEQAAAVLDVPLVEALGMLAGLGYAAARNSLSQAGLHISSRPDPQLLLDWLADRRAFPPLRESERCDPSGPRMELYKARRSAALAERQSQMAQSPALAVQAPPTGNGLR